jgi:hypothetical protein
VWTARIGRNVARKVILEKGERSAVFFSAYNALEAKKNEMLFFSFAQSVTEPSFGAQQ